MFMGKLVLKRVFFNSCKRIQMTSDVAFSHMYQFEYTNKFQQFTFLINCARKDID